TEPLDVAHETMPPGDYVRIEVIDSGVGIPKDVQARIFEPFFTTKPAGQGTGLGLSICHDIIVERHGGRLSVETERGQFTEFIIVLPNRSLNVH
ncbi:MAG TPA: ATP-binding protein, partial [Vicinamibacterales bacterium]